MEALSQYDYDFMINKQSQKLALCLHARSVQPISHATNRQSYKSFVYNI